MTRSNSSSTLQRSANKRHRWRRPSDLIVEVRLVTNNRMSMTDASLVAFAPPAIVRRQTAAWSVIETDNVEGVRHEGFEYRFEPSSRHLLMATERAERYDGETLVDGLPKSHLRAWNRKMTFVPAGCGFYGWQQPRALSRVCFFYLDLHSQLLRSDLLIAVMLF